jgi:hypothetical protein
MDGSHATHRFHSFKYDWPFLGDVEDSKVHDARNNERHVCGRRRDGEAAVSCLDWT